MIVTVTVNPSLDRTLQIQQLERGAVHRASRARLDPGGKGVNIARALSANGRKARAVLPAGGANSGQIAGLLDEAGIDYVGVAITDVVRTNISVVEADGTVTKFNSPGPTLSADELDELCATIVSVSGGASWVALAGSLTPGAPVDLYARLAHTLHDAGCRVAVDASGRPFIAALRALPDVVKPNLEELSEAVHAPLPTLGDVVEAARTLRAAGAGAVLASLGADGLVLVDGTGARHGEARVDVVRSAVGAGDATLAGFLAAGGEGEDALREALAWGAATVQLPGSRMPTPDDLPRQEVVIHDHLDLDRRLRQE